MGEALILDTAFLIDLEREQNLGRPGRAISFLEARENARLYISFTIAGEIASGVSMSERKEWETFLGSFYLLPSTPEVSWEYGQIFQHLRKNSQLIGANDMWIAATALVHRMPVVTADITHFQRVPGLDVRRY
jgi:predicted nucleic acid-binding protein